MQATINGRKESESELSETIATFSSKISFVERLKICFKPKYQLRRIKNKGAILALMFSFLVWSVYFYIFSVSFDYCRPCYYAIIMPIGMMFPIAGCLADLYFGRFKVLYWSVLVMWISSVLLTVTFIAPKYVEPYESSQIYLQVVFTAFLGLGYGGFQANIIQFSIDQLTDASSNEIISCINWYAWVYLSCGGILNYIRTCSYKFITPLLICVSLCIVTSLLFVFKNFFIIEPPTQNPFKLIFGVIKYAIKTKQPRQRSAFTFWEDNLPPRIDFGKSKYGGPFSTGQVEDVKTFLRMVGIIVLVGIVFGLTNESGFRSSFDNFINSQASTNSLGDCLVSSIYVNIYYITGMVLIPVNEFIIHPIFRRCLPHIVSHWKVGLGIGLHIGRYIVFIILVTHIRQHAAGPYVIAADYEYSAINTSLSECLLYEDTFVLKETLDYQWFALPEFLSTISDLLIVIGAIEFYCAQVPYSMKGLIAVIFYTCLGISLIFNRALLYAFEVKSVLWSGGTKFSCAFWYLQTKIILLVILLTCVTILMKLYKRRKREDVLPNEHIFAERYYST